MKPDFYIEVYKGKQQGRQVWRWRVVSYGNNRKMASGGEAYTNKQDCTDAAVALFGPATTVHLSHPHGEMVVREGTPPPQHCPKCGHHVAFHADEGCTLCGCALAVTWA